MNPYSLDLRVRVLKDVDAGVGTREVALKYDVSESWVRRLKQRRREHGEIEPRSSRNRRQPKWLAHADRLQQLVQAKPDITLRELREALGEEISIQTLSRALRQLQLTFKKK
jgi:transposase